MANYFWQGSVSQAFNDEKNWVTASGGSTQHTSAPGASDDLFYDVATLANQCDFATAHGLTVKSITVQDGLTASTLFNTVAARSLTIKDTLTVNEHTVFAFAQTFTFIFDGSGTQFTVYDGDGTNDASVPDAYIKLGLNAGESMFSSETVRGRITFDFTQDSGTNSMTLVDGVYPNMTNIGTVHAKFITSDANATAFNTYGSVDMLNWSGGSVTSTSRNVHDYDKEFFFEALTSVGETFQFGHTTARFKSGSANFRLPVFGDVYTNFGNNTTNTFNVQYHKVIIEAGDDSAYYCRIQPGKTLECNELVVRDGGRFYGPAEGMQVASAKIKSVKRPTVQGDWNFKQIADGIYESIDNIPTLPVTEGGTGLNTVAVNSLLIGQGQLPLSTLAMGSADQVLKVKSDGTGLEFDAVSGGGGAVSAVANGANNRVATFSSADALNGEANLTFDGSTLAVTGDLNIGSGDLFVDDSSGRVGIGIGTSPINLLHVKGDNSITNQNSGGAASITVEQDGTGDAAINFLLTGVQRYIVGIDNSDGDKFKIQTGGTSLSLDAGTARQPGFAMDTNGNVGIGTTNPQANLHITSGDSGDAVLILEADTDNNLETDQPYIVFEQDGGVQNSAVGLTSGNNTDNNALMLSNSVGSSGVQAGIVFKTGTTDGYTNAVERMRILPAGGIKFNNAYTFPTADGGANATLTTDGSGSIAFRDMTYHRKPAVFMDSGNINVTTTEVTIPFDTEVLDPAGNASLATGLGQDGHIRLAAAGYYKISYSIPINDDSTVAADRTRVFVDMQTSSSSAFSSFSTVAQSRAQVYTRENSGGSGLSTTFIYQHTANDYIRLRIDAQLGTDISTETNESQISIEYIGPA